MAIEKPTAAGATRYEKCKSAAACHLKRKGYEILERGFETRFGTLDFIAREEGSGTICFINVIASDGASKLPDDAYSSDDMRRFEHMALVYAINHDVPDDAEFRFDSIKMRVKGDGSATLYHRKNCFVPFA